MWYSSASSVVPWYSCASAGTRAISLAYTRCLRGHDMRLMLANREVLNGVGSAVLAPGWRDMA